MKRSMAVALAALTAIALLAMISGCGGNGTGPAKKTELILATTTSTQDSGLLDEWVPMFEAENPYTVKVIAVGSGAAMEMGRNGECDVMLVHSPAAEEELVAAGYAIDRNAVMHSDFVVVGPASDPAGIRGAATAAEAFARVFDAQAPFISRADGSGTHARELGIWDEAGFIPAGAWYVESGKGMGDTLRVASERRAYTLADRGTYLSLKRGLELEILLQGDAGLRNDYHVMNVNPEKWPDVNAGGAMAFNAFCISREAQQLLEDFGVGEYGEPLFYPDAL